MARIEEFEAKDLKLTPSDKGYTAVETAARRIGPLYGQMAAGARELGNLTKAGDEAIGRSVEAFLRFQGLSTQGGGGVKVEKGGQAERTLLGTGSGEFGYANARANAANARAEAGPGASAKQFAAEAKAAAKLQVDQLADQLKAKRDAEDAQRKIDYQAQDAERAEQLNDWMLQHPDETQAAKDYMRAAVSRQNDQIKHDRLVEEAQLKATRDTQDAAIKEGRAADVLRQLDYKTKGELSNGAVVLSSTALDAIRQTTVLRGSQTISNGVNILETSARRAALAPAAPSGPSAAFKEGTVAGQLSDQDIGAGQPGAQEIGTTGEAATGSPFGTGAGDLSGQVFPEPTYTGDVPAVANMPQAAPDETTAQPASAEFISNPDAGYAQEIPNQPQVLQAPIDQDNAPQLYTDMTGGM